MERTSALNQNHGRNSKPAYSEFPDIASLIMESFNLKTAVKVDQNGAAG
jgi:hypothetical protein